MSNLVNYVFIYVNAKVDFLFTFFHYVIILRMSIDRNTVNRWLDRQRRSQKWLAVQCSVTEQAVSNWLREKKPRPISATAQIIIRTLMEEDAAASQAGPSHHLVLEFADDQFEAIEQAALKNNETARQWAKRTLNDIAGQDAKALAAELRRANNFGTGSTDLAPRQLNESTQSTRAFSSSGTPR